MIYRAPTKLATPLFVFLLLFSGTSGRCQDGGSPLTIPGLKSDTPGSSNGNREFYATPHRNDSDKAASSIPSISAEPPTEGDFSVSVRVSMLRRFVDDQRVESNNVATRVMEADVRGVQTTVTNIALESTESPEMARLNIMARGTVNSNTIGYTPQARVATAGNHTFNITKPIYFDGRQFLTKAAYGGLQVHQVPQAVNSMASGMPLLGPIGDQIAWGAVMRRMPTSDSIVARRVADDVFPKVNSSVDEKLRGLNEDMRKLQEQLKVIVGRDEVEWKARSSSESFTTMSTNRSIVRSRRGNKHRLRADLDPVEAAAVLVSEDNVNHMLARLPISGVTVSDATLSALVAAFQKTDKSPAEALKVLRRLDEFRAEPLLFSLRFAETAPLQMLFRDGLLQVHATFSVLPKLGEASQMQTMKVRLGGKTADDGMWSLFAREIAVEPASRNELPDSWTTLISGQATKMTDRIPSTELPRQIDLRRFDDRLPALRIHRIQSTGGQLRVSFKSEEIPPPFRESP